MIKKFNHKSRYPGLRNYFFVLTLNILLLALSATSLNAMADTQKIIRTLKMHNVSLTDVLKSLETQSGYSFIYNNEDVAKVKGLNLNYESAMLETILSECLKGTSLGYIVVDDTIVIRSGDRRTQQPQTAVRAIEGVVRDQYTNPIVGATVVQKGSSNGVSTDGQGHFKISVPQHGNIVLNISSIGMKTKDVTVSGSEPLSIILEEEVTQIDRVVVTGMFTREASSFTGSVVSMKREDLLKVGNQNVFQSIKNLDPSLMIFDDLQYGSDPNRTPTMQLRGTSSFDLGGNNVDIKGTYGTDPNQPLFILDGFETTVEKVMDLDMNRIESVTILKDASAKAIYGSKAANGVVVIETIKNTSGELRLRYTGSVDVSMPDLSSYNLVNAAQKLEIEKAAGIYAPAADRPQDSEIPYLQKYNRILTAVLAGVDTDWLAKPLRTGIGTKHAVSFELGSDDLQVLADLSYHNELGVMKGSDRTTTAGSIMISYRHRKFNFRNILSVTSNKGYDSPYGDFSEYARMNPYWSPYDENGRLLENVVFQYSDNPDAESEFVANPLYNAQLNTVLSSEYIDITNNTYVEWHIASGLKATGRLGITEKRTRADEFYPANHLSFRTYSEDDLFRRGSYQLNEGWNRIMSADLNINWARAFGGGQHVVFSNLGFSASENSFEELIFNAEGFPNDMMTNIAYAKQYLQDGRPSGYESTTREFGIVGVASYSYDYRYLVDASYRVSASSLFGKNNRWGQFWSFGLGWNIHNESWMKGFENLTELKLRGSVGYTGAQSSDAYAALATYTYYMDATYDNFLGAMLSGMKNDDLKWQEKLDYNIGIDLRLGNDISLKLDGYVAETKNSLIDLTLPASAGFTSVKENVGKVRNTGFDAYLTYTLWRRPSDQAFFSIVGAISHNKNVVVEISDALQDWNDRQDNIFLERDGGSAPVNRYYEGVSMDAIWAVRSLGIDPATGNEMFLKPDGSITNVWNAADQVIVGNSLPDFSGNVGFNFSWRGWGLNMMLRYQWGGQLYNTTVVNVVENADLNYNVDKRVYDGRWREPGDIAPYRAIVNYYNMDTWELMIESTHPTSRFVEDRNELTLSSINISYDFYNRDFIKKMGMDRLTLNFYMNDIFTWSSIRIERGTSYPFARSFSFSLSATF